jgi:prepilin-type N-terminal cleavage/methylation domain-containing protein
MVRFIIYSKYGFTLIELLIALVISGLVLTAVYKVFMSNNLIYLKQNELTKIEQNMRAAMDILTRDIRISGYNSTNNTVLGIGSTSSSTKIILDYENDDSGDVEEKEYYFDNNQKRIENKSGISIANNIGMLEFKYCNGTKSIDCYSNYVPNTSIVKLSIAPYTDKNFLSVSNNLSMNKTVYIRNECLN